MGERGGKRGERPGGREWTRDGLLSTAPLHCPCPAAKRFPRTTRTPQTRPTPSLVLILPAAGAESTGRGGVVEIGSGSGARAGGPG